jgi:isopenicillin-N epimerase
VPLREQFALDPDVAYLNHGSFGACPLPVREAYRHWQDELEREPVEFLDRRAPDLLAEAREALAAYVGARRDDLVWVTNATTGLNAVVRSLRLGRDDEVLTTAHEYGAILRAWHFVGARVVRAEPDELPDRIGERTRVVFLSHVTSATALLLPVERACRAAREAGALSVVDGAHAPGQLPLDLEALGADIYVGNCHKWLCAPKGAGFLWARPEQQPWIEPLVVSWGWEPDAPFAERHRWHGTDDPAACLAVPAAIEFVRGLDPGPYRRLAASAQRRLADAGFAPVPGTPAPQMVAVELPPGDADELRRRLYDEHRIEVALQEWEGRRLLRVSIAPYNDEEDVDRLIQALDRVL